MCDNLLNCRPVQFKKRTLIEERMHDSLTTNAARRIVRKAQAFALVVGDNSSRNGLLLSCFKR